MRFTAQICMLLLWITQQLTNVSASNVDGKGNEDSGSWGNPTTGDWLGVMWDNVKPFAIFVVIIIIIIALFSRK